MIRRLQKLAQQAETGFRRSRREPVISVRIPIFLVTMHGLNGSDEHNSLVLIFLFVSTSVIFYGIAFAGKTGECVVYEFGARLKIG